MDSARSSPDPRYLAGTDQVLIKLLIAGPFAVGKTTLIRAISEIAPLHTEEVMTQAGALVDHLAGVKDKTTTTVAIDFGRLTLPNNLVLYLFGTPGQRRFRLLWEDIAQGAVGALVMVDTRRLEESFEVMDLIEEAGLRYAVAVNPFPEAPTYDADTLRDHLDLHPGTPLVLCDARSRGQSLDALIALVEHVIAHMHMEPA
ncbi:GTP-binding protein [Streptomyces sp. RPT161]|uniref:GTP-binding protein n=1 Tax=Streptomyces sp. RPT161 TaxID=3015993 RepID=UPI0022B8A2C0|nr:ATP/GTP-binding protein [Streptomyces sp. RPT161]